MSFETLMSAAGLRPRSYQLQLAESVHAHLAAGEPIAVAVQATTGVGKTWALAHAAVEAARAGQRVVWSTHTTFLRSQVLATLEAALCAAWPSANGRPRLAEKRGRADYPSRSRTMRMRHALADRKAPAEDIVLLDALAQWPGTIADFVAVYGELPVAQSLISLNASCPAEEQAVYAADRNAAAGAEVIVQTHALTLIEARFGRLEADLIIFDEADTLAGVASGAVETRLPLDDLVSLAAECGADIANAAEDLRVKANGAAIVRRDQAVASAAKSIAAAFRASRADVEPELAELLHDTAEALTRFAGVDAPKTGAALVTDDAAGVTLAVAAVDAAGWLGSTLRDRQVVLMSATLGRFEEDDLAAACRRLGFHQVEQVTVSPNAFGTVAYCLADRSVPRPFPEGETKLDPAFVDYATAMIQQAARQGRTLVLCASYSDAEALRAKLPGHMTVQQRGQRLATLLDRFASEPGAVLVTPAGWAGIDLPHLVDNVVVVRLPVPRPDRLRELVLSEALASRGMSQADARNILASEARADTIRRLTQGMGRGVRAADDRCTVWIADPRFPLPASMVIDLRRRLTQGPAVGWQEVAKAIPQRFRKDGARSAYGRAKIIPLAPVAAVAA
jgi:ATP-dependent DNA helicase DinG